jgi:hypothetical protein
VETLPVPDTPEPLKLMSKLQDTSSKLNTIAIVIFVNVVMIDFD